jgi:hypothetical protein
MVVHHGMYHQQNGSESGTSEDDFFPQWLTPSNIFNSILNALGEQRRALGFSAHVMFWNLWPPEVKKVSNVCWAIGDDENGFKDVDRCFYAWSDHFHPVYSQIQKAESPIVFCVEVVWNCNGSKLDTIGPRGFV